MFLEVVYEVQVIISNNNIPRRDNYSGWCYQSWSLFDTGHRIASAPETSYLLTISNDINVVGEIIHRAKVFPFFPLQV